MSFFVEEMKGGADPEPPPFISKGRLGSPSDAARCGWSQAEFDMWQPHSCGTCCLKMIGDSRGYSLGLTLAEVTEICVQKGVFRHSESGIQGAFHFPMVDVLAEWGIPAEVRKHLPVADVVAELSKGGMVILSVDLRKLAEPHDSTHLVVVFDYDPVAQQFAMHDSASVLSPDGNGMQIQRRELDRISNHRGIVVQVRH